MMKKFILSAILPILLFGGEGYVASWRSDYYSQSLEKKLYSATTQETLALTYLNSLRQKAGLNTLSKNSYLITASQNHVNYMVANNAVGHQEYSNYDNFTGEWPADRAVHVGYKSRMVSENLSWGQNDTNESIDGLFSAIYHRFGFLDDSINEIGVGVNQPQKFYNYDMGNSYLNDLCSGESFEGTGQDTYGGVCADENFKISLSDFNDAKFDIQKNNPKILLWPIKNATDIPPAFFEESPDPLPNQSVSGYPISVSFNSYFFATSPTVTSFQLFDSDNNEITDTKLLDSENDPNNELSQYQYALFPLKRLEWGKVYKALFKYNDGEAKEISWSFKTKTLSYPYYRIDGTVNQTLDVISGKTYAIYFVPQNENDNLGGYSYSYDGGVSMDSDYIDSDTIKVTLNGSINKEATLNFNNGASVILKISSSDTAITSDENLTDINGSDETNTTNFSDLSDDEKLKEAINPAYYDEIINIINKKADAKFQAGEDYVVSNYNEFNLTKKADIILTKEKINNLQTGWTLVGTTFKITDLSIFSNVKIVWIYDVINSTWVAYTPNSADKTKITNAGYSIFSTIPKESGVWILK